MIEVLRFRLTDGADEEGFLAADKRVQQEFAYQRAGLLRRTTARGRDGSWAVFDVWRSATDADATDAVWGADEATRAFMAFVDRTTVTTERYFELD